MLQKAPISTYPSRSLPHPFYPSPCLYAKRFLYFALALPVQGTCKSSKEKSGRNQVWSCLAWRCAQEWPHSFAEGHQDQQALLLWVQLALPPLTGEGALPFPLRPSTKALLLWSLFRVPLHPSSFVACLHYALLLNYSPVNSALSPL